MTAERTVQANVDVNSSSDMRSERHVSNAKYLTLILSRLGCARGELCQEVAGQ